MKPKLTTVLITALLLMAGVSSLVAQDKYEYASIRYNHCSTGQDLISTSTKDGYSEKEVSKSEFEGKRNLSNIFPVIEALNEMGKSGWEVEAVNNYPIAGNGCSVEVYTLKRKLQ